MISELDGDEELVSTRGKSIREIIEPAVEEAVEEIWREIQEKVTFEGRVAYKRFHLMRDYRDKEHNIMEFDSSSKSGANATTATSTAAATAVAPTVIVSDREQGSASAGEFASTRVSEQVRKHVENAVDFDTAATATTATTAAAATVAALNREQVRAHAGERVSKRVSERVCMRPGEQDELDDESNKDFIDFLWYRA